MTNSLENTVSWINPQSNTEVRKIPVGAGPRRSPMGSAPSGSRTPTIVRSRESIRLRARSSRRSGRRPSAAAWPSEAASCGSRTRRTGSSSRSIPARTRSWESGRRQGADGRGVRRRLRLGRELSRRDRRAGRPGDARSSRHFPRERKPVRTRIRRGQPLGRDGVRRRAPADRPAKQHRAGDDAAGESPGRIAAGDGGVWVAAQSGGAGHRGGRLVVIAHSVVTIDPQLASLVTSSNIATTVYDGLTAVRRVGGSAGDQFIPDLAVALPY